MRQRHVRLLARRGFRPAASLPRVRTTRLRPIREIAARTIALDALCAWVMEDPAETPSARIRAYAARNRATKWMTAEERAIFKLPKARVRTHVDTIGWRLENLCALAWVLGFSPTPAVDGNTIPAKIFRALVLRFMPGLTATVDDLVEKAKNVASP